jgi:hypothetical protein
MDKTALDELIAQVRGTANALAEAEQKVAAAKAELAQKDQGAQFDASSALLRAEKPTPKRESSGWLPPPDLLGISHLEKPMRLHRRADVPSGFREDGSIRYSSEPIASLKKKGRELSY